MLSKAIETVKNLNENEKRIIFYLYENNFEYESVLEDRKVLEKLERLGIIKEIEINPNFSRKWYKGYMLTSYGEFIAKILKDFQ